MSDISQDSLELHRKFRGKLEVRSKVPLADRHDLSLAYTPGVAAVSEAVAKDKRLAYEYTIKRNTVAVVSDGSAVLGLGNLGPEAALPVMEGKAILFKEFAGLDAFPLCLATQDVGEIVRAVQLVAPVFGGINLEDISAPRCFEIERRLKETLDIPVMHDDQHGTATVVLAGLINALELKHLDKKLVSVVVNGAGAAGIAVTQLLLRYGIKDITVCDRQGVIYDGRADLNPAKQEIAKFTNQRNIRGGLQDSLRGADVFIGVSVRDALKPAMIKAMSPDPVIFALANPIPEIMPEVAKEAGAFIVATGRSDFSNQVNNVLAFPGIFRGALDHRVADITDDMLITAAENLARYVTDLRPDIILPNPLDRGVAAVVADAIVER